jgi:uncharacterized protein (TIGR03000 family)
MGYPSYDSSYYYEPAYDYGPPTVFAPASYYSPDTSQGSNAAMLELRVPENAEVWFEGDKTSPTGTVRHFVSPSLEPGRNSCRRVLVSSPKNSLTRVSHRAANGR